ncbi:hypothetical protein CLV60_13523 [Dyadobacter jiangsuensis]|uniref:Integrase-like protein n=1 Tax=Dyadobacter jiangsuensis TaxID=1591085 RepID=A0A2P8F7U0_9BACT|nr:hypothetical protein CLV60_13523 [Dyadobacter jiangsuensis]
MAFASGSTGPCSRAAGAEEFYAIAFRKKIYENFVALQDDIDKWIHYYNSERTHSGRSTFGFLNILSDRYEMFGHTSLENSVKLTTPFQFKLTTCSGRN